MVEFQKEKDDIVDDINMNPKFNYILHNHTKHSQLKKKGGAWVQAAMHAAPIALSLGKVVAKSLRKRDGGMVHKKHKMKKKAGSAAPPIVTTNNISRGPIA